MGQLSASAECTFSEYSLSKRLLICAEVSFNASSVKALPRETVRMVQAAEML